MAPLSECRAICDRIPLAAVKRVLRGEPVRVVLSETNLLLCTRDFGEMILVEPHPRPGGGAMLFFSLRDPAVAAVRHGQLLQPGKKVLDHARGGMPRKPPAEASSGRARGVRAGRRRA